MVAPRLIWRPMLGLLAPLVLLALAACGGPAATPTPVPAADATPAPATVQTPTPTPVAEATPAPDAPATRPSGTLNVGITEMGPFDGHPRRSGPPGLDIFALAIGEGMVRIDERLEATPMLAQDWTISEDFFTWTFHIRPGVQFHKGYGEMTAEDVLYSYQQWGEEGSIHARAGFIRSLFNHPQGYVEIPESHILVVNTGEPRVDVQVFEVMRNLGGSSTWVVSKRQSEELGIEVAGRDIAATGPWEIVDHRTSEFWRMRAVEDHWRKSPNFAEMVFWEIPEESSRIAGFQTGQLDTFDMSIDTIPLVESVPGARLAVVPNAIQSGLNLYGQVYPGGDMPADNPGYNPSLAWVAGNPDPGSPEWEQARLVRQALSIAIDREAIVDTLLGGFGSPLAVRDWAGHEHRTSEHWRWEFDPDMARELLAEAGYADGFSITLTPVIRGSPGEVEACEAIATMWGDIGVDVRFQRIPLATLRPTLVARTYHGATCHSVPIRLAPVIGISNYISTSVFSYGTEHPWLEERIGRALEEVNPEAREQMELEIFEFMFDNALGAIGLYSQDTVWPVGPRIEEWQPHSFGDLKNLNSFEYIQPRQ